MSEYFTSSALIHLWVKILSTLLGELPSIGRGKCLKAGASVREMGHLCAGPSPAWGSLSSLLPLPWEPGKCGVILVMLVIPSNNCSPFFLLKLVTECWHNQEWNKRLEKTSKRDLDPKNPFMRKLFSKHRHLRTMFSRSQDADWFCGPRN